MNNDLDEKNNFTPQKQKTTPPQISVNHFPVYAEPGKPETMPYNQKNAVTIDAVFDTPTDAKNYLLYKKLHGFLTFTGNVLVIGIICTVFTLIMASIIKNNPGGIVFIPFITAAALGMYLVWPVHVITGIIYLIKRSKIPIKNRENDNFIIFLLFLPLVVYFVVRPIVGILTSSLSF